MGFNITKEAYTKLIEEDLAVLNKHMPDSLEFDHIKVVLTSSIDCYYPSEGNQPNSENANCAIFDVSGSLPLTEVQKLTKEAKELVVRLLLPIEYGEDYDVCRLYEILEELEGNDR